MAPTDTTTADDGTISVRDEVDRPELITIYDALFRLSTTWSSRSVTQLYDGIAGRPFGPVQHLVLRMIRTHAPVRLGDVAARSNMTPSNASKVVAELVDEGLVERRTPGDDRRVTILDVTAEGESLATRLEHVGARMLGERLRGFDGGEIERLADLLDRLSGEIDNWAHAARQE